MGLLDSQHNLNLSKTRFGKVGTKVNWCFTCNVQSMPWSHWAGIALLCGGDLRNRHRITNILPFTYTSSFIFNSITQAIILHFCCFYFQLLAHLAHRVLVITSREHFPGLYCFPWHLSMKSIHDISALCPTFFQKHHLDLSFLLPPKPASKFPQSRCWLQVCFVCPICPDAVEHVWISESDTSVFRLQTSHHLVNSKIKPPNFFCLSSTSG